ncbi:rhamnogalacturonan acetylesterase [Paenibacillus thailandensis]|uniref:Rhamnogalacturonan acetylesterase n=1 Tax=Paenibacillus thailandensis TaxID=393250 RepID=A0ABW5QW44_9BACL
MEYRFDFGAGEAEAGYTKVPAGTAYDKALGYGFEGGIVNERDRGGPDKLRGSFCIPVNASFLVDLPDGNYTVTVTMGDQIAPTTTTLKAGPNRMILHEAAASAGQFLVRSFTTNVNTGQLKLSFSGIAPRVNAVTIRPAPQATTIFLAGDSTVTDQETFPYAGWGQMLPLYLNAEVAVVNEAKSGRSSKSFLNEGRLQPILDRIKPKDFLFIQFGHNDEKTDEERATDPFTTYKQYLNVYIKEARERGAIPVLITPVQRRKFGADGKIIDTHGDYVTAMKELAAEENVPLIDLTASSTALYESMGDEPSKALFMWAYPGEFAAFPEGAKDDTHFQELGGIRIAGLVKDGIKELGLMPLCVYLRD